jgi:hypothetical protein
LNSLACHLKIFLENPYSLIKLPNNASQGLQRLKGLKSKMTKNPKFKDDYVAFMDNLFEKGYAEKVPDCELDQDDDSCQLSLINYGIRLDFFITSYQIPYNPS